MHAHLRSLIAVVAGSLLVTGTIGTSAPASAGARDTAATEPDPISLLADFANYWQPVPYNGFNPYRGTVKDTAILRHNDTVVKDINARGAADTSQAHRALIDSDMNWKRTLPDALGPVLGGYLADGISDGDLPKTSAALEDLSDSVSYSDAKSHFNYPRPFITDRSVGGAVDLKGRPKDLGITKIPDWFDLDTGGLHTALYAGMELINNQAFPSGHTTYAYTTGLGLAALLPELATPILARSSEAGNNRMVLGVHYPLDVIGGRILGQAGDAWYWSDPANVRTVLIPARTELVNYLAGRCADDHHGTTLVACIADTGAADAHSYTNTFTDAIVTVGVTDWRTARSAYRKRLSYGFDQTSAVGKPARVPAGAESLLRFAYPTLNGAQRRALLAATEIDSGYPLDASSLGWQRLDLASALSATVTVDQHARVISVKPSSAGPRVVHQWTTKTALKASTPTEQYGAPVTLTAAVKPAAAGTVTFVSRHRRLGSARVDAQTGRATWTTRRLPVGRSRIVATFTPAKPALFRGSTSSGVVIHIRKH